MSIQFSFIFSISHKRLPVFSFLYGPIFLYLPSHNYNNYFKVLPDNSNLWVISRLPPLMVFFKNRSYFVGSWYTDYFQIYSSWHCGDFLYLLSKAIDRIFMGRKMDLSVCFFVFCAEFLVVIFKRTSLLGIYAQILNFYKCFYKKHLWRYCLFFSLDLINIMSYVTHFLVLKHFCTFKVQIHLELLCYNLILH